MSVRTGGASGTEPCQPVDTENSPHVTVATVGAVSAEPAVIPGTVADLGLWVYVEEGTLLVVAGVKSGVEVTLRHLTHVVLVEELTLVPLLTQPPQPVLADNSLVAPDMSEGTGSSSLTGRPHVELAHGGPALVHPREGEGLGPELLGQGHLEVEGDVLHWGHQQLHLEVRVTF